MRSIRTHLVLWLSVLFSSVWLLVTGLTYWSSQHEVEELFDAQLAQAAAVLAQFQHLNTNTQLTPKHNLAHQVNGHQYEKKIAFQIWDNGKLMLRSASAPEKIMSIERGYSDQTIGEHRWRVFTSVVPQTQQYIITSEQYEVRNELVQKITLDVLLPLTIALPIFLLIIWLGIGRGLLPVNRIADQVARLSPQNLEPVVVKHAIPTEIHPLLSALNSLINKLNTAFEREQRFTSDAAHELQTPLASIKTQAQVALRASTPEELTHALQQIEEGVNRTSHLVQQLLALARYNPESISKEHHTLSLNQLAADVIINLEPAAHEKQIDISLVTDKTIVMLGNAAGIHIMLRNLIDNAIRYCPPQGKVTVTIHSSAKQISLRVCDTGSGIAETDLGRIFERFYRGEKNQHIIGSGLGLSIVQRIVSLHQGEISFTKGQTDEKFCVNISFPLNVAYLTTTSVA